MRKTTSRPALSAVAIIFYALIAPTAIAREALREWTADLPAATPSKVTFRHIAIGDKTAAYEDSGHLQHLLARSDAVHQRLAEEEGASSSSFITSTCVSVWKALCSSSTA